MGGYETGIGYFVGYSTNIYFFSEDTAEKKCSFYLFIYLFTYLLTYLFVYLFISFLTISHLFAQPVFFIISVYFKLQKGLKSLNHQTPHAWKPVKIITLQRLDY